MNGFLDHDPQDRQSPDNEDEQLFQHLKKIDTVASRSDDQQSEESNSIHFIGPELLETKQSDYNPDQVPAKSILKSASQKEFKKLKDIDGKIIRRSNTQNFENESTDGSEPSTTSGGLRFVVKDESLLEHQQKHSLEHPQQLLQTPKEQLQQQQIPQQQIVQSASHQNRFTAQQQPQGQCWLKQGASCSLASSKKYPRYSILKNSPLQQPGEFKNLKKIEGHIIPRLFLDEDEESGKIHFAGEIILQPSSAYHFEYDPQEQPERSILKHDNSLNNLSCPNSSHDFDKGKSFASDQTNQKQQSNQQSLQGSQQQLQYPQKCPQQEQGQQMLINKQLQPFTSSSLMELREKGQKRRSYDFAQLKNIEGKMISSFRGTGKEQDEATKKNDSIIVSNPQKQDQLEEEKKLVTAANQTTSGQQEQDQQIFQNNQLQTQNSNSPEQQEVQFAGEEILQEPHVYERNKMPKKPILNLRSKSVDLKKLKDIDGRYLRRKSAFNDEEKGVHFGIVIEGTTEQLDQYLNLSQKKPKGPILKKEKKKENQAQSFSTKWNKLLHEYQESAYALLETIEPEEMQDVFQNGIDGVLLEQIIIILNKFSQEQEKIEKVKDYVNSIFKAKYFDQSLSSSAKEVHKQTLSALLQSLTISQIEYDTIINNL